MSSFGVLLDANVLVQAAVRDTLLRAAAEGLYRPFWSQDILAETERTVLRLLQKRGHGDPERQAKRLNAAMRAAFPEAMVTGYQALVPAMQNDEQDRHVLAAAITSQAQVIVTNNIGHFPPTALTPYQIEAMTADEFLADLFDLRPQLLCTLLAQQVADLQRPSTTPHEFLRHMSVLVPQFVQAVRAKCDWDNAVRRSTSSSEADQTSNGG